MSSTTTLKEKTSNVPAAANLPKSAPLVQPYLMFDGRTEEALEFYKRALGAEVLMVLRFKDSPDPSACGPVGGDKIMHSTFRVGQTEVFASDGRCEGKPNFQGITLSLTLPDEKDVDRYFNALSEGGQVHMPLAATFFSPRFGMLADRFGVSWMLYVAPQQKS